MPLIEFQRIPLLDSLRSAAAVLSGKPPRPILSNLRLSISKSGATVFGTDGEIAICSKISGMGPSEFSLNILLPAKQIIEIIGELRTATVDLHADGSTIRITSGKSKFNIPTADAVEFPASPDAMTAIDQSSWTIRGNTLREMIRQTSFAIDKEAAGGGSSRGMDNVMFDFGDADLTLASTDSRRLAMTSAPCGHDGDGVVRSRPVAPAKGMLVGMKTLELILKSVPDSDGIVKLRSAGESGIVLQFGTAENSDSTTIFGRLSAGSFPVYRRVFETFEKPLSQSLKANAGQLASIVRQSSITTSDESKAVMFTFDPGNAITAGTVSLTSGAANVGNSSVELEVEFGPKCTEAVEVKLMPHFVADFLKAVPLNFETEWRFGTSDEPVLMIGPGEYRYLLMCVGEAKS